MSALLLAQGAAAEPQDAQAERALREALEEDYLQTRFDDAEQKLRAALKACGDDGCSRGLMARIHAALGSVLAGGKKELEDARDEFIAALQLDPKVGPNPDIASAAVTFSFEQAQKKLKGTAPAQGRTAPTPGPRSKPSPYDDGSGVDPPTTPDRPLDKPSDGPSPPVRLRRNWITLSFGPDLSIVSGENVCTREVRIPEHFVCLREDGTRYVGTPTLNMADNLNTGIGLSTIRLMLGYDRLFGENFTLGGRVGFAFNGATGDRVSFIPLHLEARFSYWPRSRTFTGAVVRPYLFAAAGLAQVDTKVNDVEVLEDGVECEAEDPASTLSPCTKKSPDQVLEKRKQTLTVYKQAGTGFAAVGAGIQLAPLPNFGINIGLRGGVSLPVVTAVFSPELGLTLGF
jgi:hypothetical protein